MSRRLSEVGQAHNTAVAIAAAASKVDLAHFVRLTYGENSLSSHDLLDTLFTGRIRDDIIREEDASDFYDTHAFVSDMDCATLARGAGYSSRKIYVASLKANAVSAVSAGSSPYRVMLCSPCPIPRSTARPAILNECAFDLLCRCDKKQLSFSFVSFDATAWGSNTYIVAQVALSVFPMYERAGFSIGYSEAAFSSKRLIDIVDEVAKCTASSSTTALLEEVSCLPGRVVLSFGLYRGKLYKPRSDAKALHAGNTKLVDAFRIKPEQAVAAAPPPPPPPVKPKPVVQAAAASPPLAVAPPVAPSSPNELPSKRIGPPGPEFVRAWTNVEAEEIKKRDQQHHVPPPPPPPPSPPSPTPAVVQPAEPVASAAEPAAAAAAPKKRQVSETPATDIEDEPAAAAAAAKKPAPPSASGPYRPPPSPKEVARKSPAVTKDPFEFEAAPTHKREKRHVFNTDLAIKHMKDDKWKPVARALESDKAGKWRSDRNTVVTWGVVAFRALIYGRLTGDAKLATEASQQLFLLTDTARTADRRITLGCEPDRTPLDSFDPWYQFAPSGLSPGDEEMWNEIVEEEYAAFQESWCAPVKTRFAALCNKRPNADDSAADSVKKAKK